jgi:Ca-activated chloride channel family protein
MQRFTRFSLVAFNLALCASLLQAQLKVDVALVNVVATVTDEAGRFVHDLNENDFVLKEDGVVQKIAHFSQSQDKPVSVGIVLDTSGSMQSKISTATRAVERFVRDIHRDDDVFLMGFADMPTLHQDFTADRDRLSTALRRIRVEGGTALYDALYQGLRRARTGQHDKKALLLISDGEDTSSSRTFENVLLSVRESELLVYALGIAPPSARRPLSRFQIPGIPGGPRRSGGRRSSSSARRDTIDMDVLRAVADASGGKSWQLDGEGGRRSNQIQDALDQIAAELRSQYNFSYYPSHPLKDGQWHRVEVQAKNRRYHVRMRKEYFGG